MIISYLSDSIIPSQTANSIHVMKMCEAFSILGNETHLFSKNTFSSLKNIDNFYKFYNVNNNFIIHKHPLIPIPTRFSKYIYPPIVSILSKLTNPDIVYCRDIRSCYISCKLKMNTVFEAHQSIEDYGSENEKKIKSFLCNTYLKKIVLISNELKKLYLKNYPQLLGKMIVAHDAADDTEVTESIEGIVNNNFFNIGYTGSLHKGRGIELIIELAKKTKFAYYHIIGGNKSDLLYWKNTTKNISNITFYGYINPSNIKKYLISFDALVAPYQKQVYIRSGKDTSQYMSPLKIFEYMSSKKPIVCSNHTVLKEVLTNNENSILVEPDDTYSWIKAITNLYCNEDLRNRLSSRAYIDFINNYTWLKRAEYILNNIG